VIRTTLPAAQPARRPLNKTATKHSITTCEILPKLLKIETGEAYS
jgi:hypothetical protein